MIDRLKEFRKITFKSQLDFANALNISRAMVSEYENGKTSLSTDKLATLANNYSLNLNWLLCGQGEMLLTYADKLDINQTLLTIKKENERLQIENQLLKELIKK